MADITPQQVQEIMGETGADSATVVARLKARGHNVVADTTAAQPQGPLPPPPPMTGQQPSSPQSLVQQGVGALPTIGGALGGLMGPAGAALGGAGGEGLRQIVAGGSQLMGGPDLGQTYDDPKQAALAMLKEGGLQGAYDLGGRAAGAAVGKFIGKPAMQMALRRIKMAGTDVAKVALENGIAVKAGNYLKWAKGGLPAGLQKLQGRIKDWSLSRFNMLEAANQAGHVYQPADIAKEVADQLKDTIKGSTNIKADRLRELAGLSRQWLRDNPDLMDPHKLLQLRQEHDALSAPIYKQIEMAQKSGKVPMPDVTQQLEANWHKAMADWARNKLHTMDVPGVGRGAIKPVDEQLEKLIHLQQVIQPQVEKALPWMSRMSPYAIGAGLGGSIGLAKGHTPSSFVEGATAGALLTHPAVLSQAALALTSPALRDMILPNLIRTGALAGQNSGQ